MRHLTIALSLFFVIATSLAWEARAPGSAHGEAATATTADAVTIVAAVYGDALKRRPPRDTQTLILTRLVERYIAAHGLQATARELNTHGVLIQMRLESQLGDGYPDAAAMEGDERAHFEAYREAMNRAMIEQWKFYKALHAQYGGGVILENSGAEPVEALRRFLEARHAAGDFEFFDREQEAYFWAHFRADHHQRFLPEAEAEQAFDFPPWSKGEGQLNVKR
ncbi:MAG: hypothetical protein AAGH19_04470 [Pseudomonadota bacterium]